MIWEAHYSRMAGHFGMEKIVVVLQNIFIGQNFDRTSTSISDLALPVPLPSHPSRSKDYTPLFLLPRGLGNPSRWITCLAFHPPSKDNDCVFVVVDQFSKMVILTACKKSITMTDTAKLFFERVWVHFGYHRPSSPIGITGSSTHFGQVSGHCWTPSSLNPLPSTLKLMAK
jgi:hypothetical protein